MQPTVVGYILSDGSATPWSRRSLVRRSKPLPFNGHSKFSEMSRFRALSDKMLKPPLSSRILFSAAICAIACSRPRGKRRPVDRFHVALPSILADAWAWNCVKLQQRFCEAALKSKKDDVF
jgi:hypothetical protein